MKYFLLTMLAAVTACHHTHPVTEYDDAPDRATIEGKATALRILSGDPNLFRVSEERDDEGNTVFSRNGEQVLLRRPNNRRHVVQADGIAVANILVGSSFSPRILTTPGVGYAMQMEPQPDGTLLLYIHGKKGGWFEAYRVTAKSVTPVPFEEYRLMRAQAKGQTAIFDSLRDNLKSAGE